MKGKRVPSRCFDGEAAQHNVRFQGLAFAAGQSQPLLAESGSPVCAGPLPAGRRGVRRCRVARWRWWRLASECSWAHPCTRTLASSCVPSSPPPYSDLLRCSLHRLLHRTSRPQLLHLCRGPCCFPCCFAERREAVAVCFAAVVGDRRRRGQRRGWGGGRGRGGATLAGGKGARRDAGALPSCATLTARGRH
jgi:hypothetical protein